MSQVESENLNDLDEFDEDEKHPLEKLLMKRGKNQFVFDPENGGGRRRRIKKLSRLELLGYESTRDIKQVNSSQPKHLKPKT